MNKKHLIEHWEGSPTIKQKLAGRMFPGPARQGVGLPYLTIRRLATTRFNDLEGEDGITTTSLQVSVFASTDDEARVLAELIRNRTSGYRGTMEDTTVHGCTIEGERERSAKRADGSDQWVHEYLVDYRITYAQAVPTLT